MTVIIPHQDDELKLRNIQKKLISQINKESNTNDFFYELIPLWIFISEEQIKEKIIIRDLGKSIKQVQLGEIYKENNCSEIGINVNISTNNGELQGRLPLASSYKNKIQNNIEVKLEELPMKLKIFRVGTATKPTKNSMAVSDFVWVKLKN